MELDDRPEGTTWRVRVRLADHPGALAAVTARLAERGCNLLGLSVLPVGADPADGAGRVVDELVLFAPGDLTPEDLTAAVAAPDARCIGVTAASVGELVDAPTGALRAATGVLSGAASVADAVGRLLAAESIECSPVAPAATRSMSDADDPVRLDEGGCRARIDVDGSTITVTRSWAPFTEVELARVTALVDLLASAPLPAAPPAGPRPRRQLSSLDVQFLNGETATAPTHVGSLTILDPTGRPGGPVTVGELRRLIGSRVHLVAPLRWRLHQVPLGLDLPYWLDSGAVDMLAHVREVTLPGPGTDEQLGALVADLAARPLDRDRPLWEAHLIHGLAGGRQALYTKVHHAVIDGVSGAEVLAVVLDLEPTPRRVPRPPAVVVPEPAPSAAEMAGRGVRRSVRSAVRLVRSAPAMLPHLTALPGAGAVPGATLLAVAARVPRPAVAARTALNEPVSAERAFAFTSLPLDEVKAVRRALGLTVNDVVMTLCTTALRRWLATHDLLPDGPLVAGVPVSVRTPEQSGTGGNRISFMLADLPTDVADPLQRVRLLQASLGEAKRRFTRVPPGLLHDATAVLPQALHGALPRTLLKAARRGRPPMNLLVSNVPGPQLPLYAAGARVVANHPVSVISDVSGGINLTVMSYDGHLDVGVVACRRIVPDVWTLTGHLRAALDELLELAERVAYLPSAALA